MTTDIELLLLGAFGVLLLLIFISFILIIALWVKLNRLRKKYMAMINGSGSSNMEDVFIGLQETLGHLNAKAESSETKIAALGETMKHMMSRLGIVRYNAFAEKGSDLSFSLAIVNEYEDGVVISGIHGRDESYVYAKPLSKGHSKYPLSPEEKEAINRALKPEQPMAGGRG